MISKDEEISEMTKLTYLIREKSTSTFISNWKPLKSFCWKKKVNLWFMGLKIRKGSLFKKKKKEVMM